MTSSCAASLPPRLKAAVQHELKPGEEQLWNQRASVRAEIPSFATWACITTSISLSLVFLWAYVLHRGEDGFNEPVDFFNYSFPVVLIILVLVPWQRFLQIHSTVYVITNQRILWLRTRLLGKTVVHSITPEQLGSLRVMLFPDDRATFHFREIPSHHWLLGRGNKALAFFRVKNGGKVMHLLASIAQFSDTSAADQQ